VGLIPPRFKTRTRGFAGESIGRTPVLLGTGRFGGETPCMADTPRGEEWFDVVDEGDVVVSRATRREVHARGLRHRAVHVLVFNRAGEVFLQKRAQSKDTAPGAWDSSASGHLEAGEDYDACAVREAREEIGLALAAPPARWLRLPACAETGQEFVWVYRVASEGPFTLLAEEIEQGAWWPPAKVDQAMREAPGRFAASFRLIWRRRAERGDRPA
jgi:isopentenyl-diphosphate Delta-isomerase